MKQKTVAMVLSGLLVLTLAGCSGSPLGKPASNDKGDVTSDSTPKIGADTSKEDDKKPKSSDATGETTIMGEVANIGKDTITLSSVRVRPQTTNDATSGTPASDSSSLTGETKEIEVTSDTNITLKSGKSGVLSDIKTGDIIIVQMSGNIVKSITVETADSGKPDKSAPASGSKTDTTKPAGDSSASPPTGSSKP